MVRRLTSLFVAGLIALAAPGAHAQPGSPSPAERQAARALADEGLSLFDAGRFAESFERFSKAESIVHAPPHLLYMARSKSELGELLLARDLYDKLGSEQLGADAPPPFVGAQESGRAEREALAAAIPTLTVVVTGAGAGLALTVDGVTAALDAPLPLNPGEHEVRLASAGEAPQKRTVELAKGQHERIMLQGIGPVPSPDPEPGSDSDAGPLATGLLPPAVLFGVGALGLAVGTGTGVAALGKAGDLKDACPTNPCSPDNQGLADSANALGIASTVSFVVSGLAVAGGVVWLVLEPPGSGEEPAAVNVEAGLSPGGVWLGGAFQ